MKLSRFALPLTLALVATLATTACKHKSNIGVTKLNSPGPGVTGPGTPEPMPDTKPIDTGTQIPVSTQQPMTPDGHYQTALFDIKDYNPDPEALAAYTVHFKFDSAVVEESEQSNLASVAQKMAADANDKLLIEGHCDERGTEEYNRSLGERRALALREALAKVGVDAMRVKTESFGKDKPVDPGHDEAAWAKNRRGVFILLHPKTPVQ